MGDAAEKRNVLPLSRSRARRVRGHHVGTLVGWDSRGPLVECPAMTGRLPALSTVLLDESMVASDVAEARQVLLVFEEERADRPIIVGVVEPSSRVLPKRAAVSARVDGRDVLLEGNERVELRCGKASLVLTKSGKVLIQGTYISSRSSGAHRIRGGAVEIN